MCRTIATYLVLLFCICSDHLCRGNGDPGLDYDDYERQQKVKKPCIRPVNYHQLRLAVQWQPGYCVGRDCIPYFDRWSIHGTWPQFDNDTWPERCCYDTERFHPSKIDQISNEMLVSIPILSHLPHAINLFLYQSRRSIGQVWLLDSIAESSGHMNGQNMAIVPQNLTSSILYCNISVNHWTSSKTLLSTLG